MIGVVTVTYNSAEVLAEFLDCMSRQTVPFRLYAVDNASSDASVEMLRGFDDDRIEVIAETTNGGIAVGNNVGIRRALSDGCTRVLLLNNDTEFDDDLLARLSDTADANRAGIVVPSIRYFSDPDVVWFEAADFHTWRGSIPVATSPLTPPGVTSIEGACTCCALVDRTVFDQVGEMDERYFVYWDDTDFFLRCFRAGVPMVLDARIHLLHKVSALTGGWQSDFSSRQQIKNRVYYVRKHHRGWRRAVGLLFTVWSGLKVAWRSDRRRASMRIVFGAFREGLAVPVSAAPTR